jgi:ATP-dependent Clp protease, protease subunit
MNEPERRRLSAWLQEQLFERRIVLLTGTLDDVAAADSAAALTILDAHAKTPIELHLDSAGGSLDALFVVIDTLHQLQAPVHVHCRGQVAGPAIGILAAADHRVAAPHTRFRLTQPTSRFSGTPDAIAALSRRQQDLLWTLYALVARRTGRPAEEIAEDIRRGITLDAGQALGYGLIDEITETTREHS